MDLGLLLAILAAISGVAFVVAFAAFPIWAIIDLLRHPKTSWNNVPGNRLVWLAIILLWAHIGAMVYLIAVRGRLYKARAETARLEGGQPGPV